MPKKNIHRNRTNSDKEDLKPKQMKLQKDQDLNGKKNMKRKEIFLYLSLIKIDQNELRTAVE